MIKKFVTVIVIVIAVFYYYLVHDIPDKQPRVLRVGSECDYVPYSWVTSKKSEYNYRLANSPSSYVDGYDIQIAKAIADYMNVEVEFRKIAWENLFDALNRKEIDVIFSGMLDTDERKKIVDFSDTYELNKSEYAILVNRRSDFTRARTLNDFSGARILGQKGTYFDVVIDQIPEVIHMPPVNSVSDMLESVVNFNVDGIIIDADMGLSYERVYTNLKLITFPGNRGFKLGFTGVCAGVRKGDNDLLDKINKAIANIPIRERKRIMDRIVSRMWENL